MPQFKNAMDVFKLLDKSNCRKCNEKTCLAFAAAVFQNRKPLSLCPHLDDAVIAWYGKPDDAPMAMDQERDEKIQCMKDKVAALDLAEAARRIGAQFARDKLTVKICGKDFSVDSQGTIYSDIHVHSWITVPFLDYIINGKGVPVSGKWMPFRELEGGKSRYRLFEQRCEKDLKRIADTYTDLFEDMIHLFNGKQVEDHYESDISLVLHPLPLIPMLICYWNPEDGLESSLNLFFDATSEENLHIDAIYALGTGMVRMFELIARRHGS